MEGLNRIQLNKYTKILVPASDYNISAETRLLIPFTIGEVIGFFNREGEIIVQPQYSMYYGEIYNKDDYIKVAVIETYGYGKSTYKRSLYGLIDSNGNEIIKPVYFSMLSPIMGKKKLFSVQRSDYKYGVLDIYGNEIVPFGKYNWIDGFDHGYARVIKIVCRSSNSQINNKRWGIINEKGEEVLATEYDNIWNFYDKNRYTVRIVKDGKIDDFTLRNKFSHDSYCEDYNYQEHYGTHYGEYACSYAQDVMGFSDDVINDAFEGDPDAYWNID